jgi:phage shock protein PspC (stress-responsive transcriptional regulator)
MDRVVSVNLDGGALSLEDGAFQTLKAYLDQAEAALSSNSDRAEILSDIEAAIADRARGYLTAHKSVVTAPEMAQILAAMGPIPAAEPGEIGAGSSSTESSGDSSPRRKLYRLRDGAMVAGVANGVGAYFSMDATIVRVLFVVAVLITGGWAGLLYIAMMFIVPSANTSEDWAAAHGLPATAQEVIEAARKRFASLSESREWGRFKPGKQDQSRAGASRFTPPSRPPAGFFERMGAGGLAIVLSVAGALATLLLFMVIGSLVTSGAFAGYAPPEDFPIWVSLLLILLVFASLAMPLQAVRVACYETLTGSDRTQAQAIDGTVSLGLIALGAWFAYLYLPEARSLMDQAWLLIRN